MKEISVRTSTRTQLVNITSKVASALAELDPAATLCHVYVPHTTAAVVVNEAADPDVATDLAAAYRAMVPEIPFAHAEGNSDAHLLATLLGDNPDRDRPPHAGNLAGDLFCRSRWAEDSAGVGERGLARSAHRLSEVFLTKLLACLVIRSTIQI